jgi:hypothetical protein
MPDDNAGYGGSTNRVPTIRECIDQISEADAKLARLRGLRGSEDNQADAGWSLPSEFRATKKETGGPGWDSRLTISREDDGLRFLIEPEVAGRLGYGDYAQITLSADQVAALRLWLAE